MCSKTKQNTANYHQIILPMSLHDKNNQFLAVLWTMMDYMSFDRYLWEEI